MDSLFQRKRLLLLILALTCIGLSLAVFAALSRLHQQDVQSRFHEQGEQIHRHLERQLNHNIDSVSHLAAFFEASDYVDPEEFQLFGQNILNRHQSMQALAWVPRVPALALNDFLHNARQLFAGYTLTVSEPQQIYLPVLYLAQANGATFSQGLDLAADAGLRQALFGVGRQASVLADSWQDNSGEKTSFLIAKRVERPNAQGYVIGQFYLQALFNNLPYNDVLSHSRITNKTTGQLLFGSGPTEGSSHCYIRNIHLPGQQWLLQSCPQDRLADIPVAAYAILVLGLVATVLLMGNFYYLYQRHGEIEQQVEERTREIEKTRIELEKASQTKSAFIANMSHEIKTPLHGITCSLELIRKAGGENQQETLGTIQQSVDYLLNTVDEVLDFANLESSRMQLEQVPVDLNELYRSICACFQQEAWAKGLQFLTGLPQEKLPNVMADPRRLRQILFNLLSNAIKFTDRGFIEFTISRHQQQHRLLLDFIVADSGIGISDEFRSELFEFFSREHTSYNQRYGGVGLGLAISKSLAELMGGKLALDANYQSGCRFILSLPFDITDKPGEDLQNTSPQQRNYGKKVLLVEDNLVNQLVTQKLLEQLGLHVQTADNGRQAVEKISQQAYDLILMDIQMPDMDGIEATQHIRSQLQLKTIILALSANTQDNDINSCLAVGMNGFLKKPLHLGLLIRELDRYFNPAS